MHWFIAAYTGPDNRAVRWPLSDKGVAREVTRELGVGVFWEHVPGEEFMPGCHDRPIFVSKCPHGPQAKTVGGPRVQADPRVRRLAMDVAALLKGGQIEAARGKLQAWLLP